MKRMIQKMIRKFYQMQFPESLKFTLPILLLLILSGIQANAQIGPPDDPEITVRFNNPQFNCDDLTYCVDVELLSDTPDRKFYGINFRFFYDDLVLEYLSLGNLPAGYTGPDNLSIQTFPGFGFLFDFGELEFFNGYVGTSDTNSAIVMSSDPEAWTTIFTLCFNIDDPNQFNQVNFCPSLVFDMQEAPADPDFPGYLNNDEGVQILVVATDGQNESAPADEVVDQFNWEYDGVPGEPFGYHVDDICVTTICGYLIPVANWAIFLAIGLMMIASVFVYRRRIS